MTEKSVAELRSSSPYSAVLTREQFLFYETRTTAKLLSDGVSDSEAIERIYTENLYQYPTEKSVRKMAATCIRRLRGMNNDALIEAVAMQSFMPVRDDEAVSTCVGFHGNSHR